MMRVATWIVGTLVAIIALVAVIGWQLPVGHVASRDAAVAAPPAAAFEVIANVEAFPTWWKDVTRVEMLPPEVGHRRFRQTGSTGSVVMEIVEQTPPSRLVTRIADPDQPFGGTWTWEITPEGSGSRITVTERGEVYNPVFRFMARFVFGYTSTIESHLAALSARLSAQ